MLSKLMANSIMFFFALSALIGTGVWLAGRHYQPTIDKLNETLALCRTSKHQQAATIEIQNAGIEALRRVEAEHQAKAEADQKKALNEARYNYGKANAVLSERTIGDVCLAAAKAFDDELRRERAK